MHQKKKKKKKTKGEGGTWLTVANFLVVRSFALEVRSWSGNDVPVNLYQTNVILCPDKKGQGSKVQLSPSKAPVLANRRQSSAASSLRARSPDSAQLSSLREPGAQPNWPSGSSGHPKGREQVPQTVTQADCHSCQVAATGTGERFTAASRPGPRLVEGHSEGFGALHDTVPSLLSGPPPSSPAGPRWGELEGFQEKPGFASYLTLHLTTTTPLWSDSPH